MDKRNLFSIGDVSKMFHLSVGSLRYYEAQGLLTPEYVDPETSYRYYSTRQFEVLNTICYLRALDMPLSQIAAFFKNRDAEVMEEMLLKQWDEVVRKQRELAVVEKKINNRLQQLQDARNSELDVIRLQEIPDCRMVRMEGKLQIHNFLDMETPIRKLHADESEAVIFLGKVGIGISRENLNSFRYDNYDCIFLCRMRRMSTMGRQSRCRRAFVYPSGFAEATGRRRHSMKNLWHTFGKITCRWQAFPVKLP